MFKDPLVRRLISGSLFAAAFIWVAVTHFNVETEVVLVLLQLSVGFVLLLIVAGLLLTPVFRLANRRRSFLADLESGQGKKTDSAGAENVETGEEN